MTFKVTDKLAFAKKMESRTANFADEVYTLCKNIPLTVSTREVVKQLVKAAGSIGANYIEANESLSKKDFFYRIRICRKESKEARYWLRRLLNQNPDLKEKITPLLTESTEFLLIFSKIISKST